MTDEHGPTSLLLLAAMPRELRPIVRSLGLRPADAAGGLVAWVGPDPSRPGGTGALVAAAAVGVGTAAAGRGTARALGRLAPAEVVVVGVAGAVDGRLGVADLVVPRTVLDGATGARYTALPAAGGRGEAIRRAALGEAPEGALLTVETLGAPLPDPMPPDTLAIDMETSAIARVCDEHHVPWVVVRAVSDVPGTVTSELRTLVRDDGRIRVGATLRLLVRHPSRVPRLVRLGLGARRAQRRLTITVREGLRSVGA